MEEENNNGGGMLIIITALVLILAIILGINYFTQKECSTDQDCEEGMECLNNQCFAKIVEEPSIENTTEKPTASSTVTINITEE